MADLVTHASVVLLPGAFVRSRSLPLLLIGTVLPDGLGRALPLALEQLLHRGWPIPEALLWPLSALHSPLGVAMWAAVGALLFVREERRLALTALLAGAALHLAVDVLQDHHGQGYALLAPLSWTTFELGWIGSEATVPWALPLLAASAAAWGARLAAARAPTALRRWRWRLAGAGHLGLLAFALVGAERAALAAGAGLLWAGLLAGWRWSLRPPLGDG